MPESPRSASGVVSRGIALVGAAVIGFFVGVVCTFTHQRTWTVAGLELPTGLLLALLCVTGTVAGLRILTGSRWMPGLAALGIVGAVALYSLPVASGSVILPANAVGYTWTFAPTLICAIVLAWPRLAPGRRSGATADG